MIEKITADCGTLIAIVVRASFEKEGVSFVSDREMPLQLGISTYKKDQEITPHAHLKKETNITELQEIIHIEKGKTEVDLFDLQDKKFRTIQLSEGDTIFFINGGHGFRMNEDTKIIEVKQGPYSDKSQDKRLLY